MDVKLQEDAENQQDLAKQEMELMQPILQDLEKVLAQVADAEKYDFVLIKANRVCSSRNKSMTSPKSPAASIRNSAGNLPPAYPQYRAHARMSVRASQSQADHSDPQSALH